MNTENHRLRGQPATSRPLLIILGLAGLGAGAWVLRYALTQATGLDTSALTASAIMLGTAMACALGWAALRRRDSRNFVEIDAAAGVYRLIWRDALWVERPLAGCAPLEVARITQFRPSPKGGAWTWFTVSAPAVFFPLYVTTSEADARDWARTFAQLTGTTVAPEPAVRTSTEEIASRKAALAAALTRGGLPAIEDADDPRTGVLDGFGVAREMQRHLQDLRARAS